MPRAQRKSARAHRRLLNLADEDPLSGMANLFDTGMVFAVAILLSLVGSSQIPKPLSAEGQSAAIRKSGTPALEVLRRKGTMIERFRVSEEILGGEGERLGTAYRLKSGEVVYVPDAEDR